jgi:hypothetical protein
MDPRAICPSQDANCSHKRPSELAKLQRKLEAVRTWTQPPCSQAWAFLLGPTQAGPSSRKLCDMLYNSVKGSEGGVNTVMSAFEFWLQGSTAVWVSQARMSWQFLNYVFYFTLFCFCEWTYTCSPQSSLLYLHNFSEPGLARAICLHLHCPTAWS